MTPSAKKLARELAERDRLRWEQIDREHAERQRTLTRSKPAPWERQRDERLALEQRIKALERALVRSERALAAALARARRNRSRSQVTRALDESVIRALSQKTARGPSDVHRRVAEDYGSVTISSVESALRRLVAAGMAYKIDGSYVREPS